MVYRLSSLPTHPHVVGFGPDPQALVPTALLCRQGCGLYEALFPCSGYATVHRRGSSS